MMKNLNILWGKVLCLEKTKTEIIGQNIFGLEKAIKA